MTLNELIKAHHWLSIKMVFTSLYADEEDGLEAYEEVYNDLKLVEPESSDMIIDLFEIETDEGDRYIDVSGYEIKEADTLREDRSLLGLDFFSWSRWLGMEIDNEALEDFTELEVICHCLYEMTFYGFNQDDINNELENLRQIPSGVEDQDTTSTPNQSVDDLLNGIDFDSDDDEEE